MSERSSLTYRLDRFFIMEESWLVSRRDVLGVVGDESLTSNNIDFGMNQGYPNVGMHNVSAEEPCLPRVYTKKEKQLPRNTSLV